LPLNKGDELTLLVLSGTSLYRVELKVGPQERIYILGKPYDAISLQGKGTRITDQGHRLKYKKVRHVSIWLRADESRLPLLLKGDTKLGPIEATLTSYQPAKRRLTVHPPVLGTTR